MTALGANVDALSRVDALAALSPRLVCQMKRQGVIRMSFLVGNGSGLRITRALAVQPELMIVMSQPRRLMYRFRHKFWN